MTTPEVLNPQKEPQVPKEITPTPSELHPDAAEKITDFGGQVHAVTPQTMKDDQGNIVIQGKPISRPISKEPLVEIPTDQVHAEEWSHGAPDDARTWLGWEILRKIKIAFQKGLKVIIRQITNL